jgi:hypothetical protein
MKRDAILAEYRAELERTLGPDVSVTVENRRILVTTRKDSPGNRYTLKDIIKAIEVLKKRPSFNPSIPDFLTIP